MFEYYEMYLQFGIRIITRDAVFILCLVFLFEKEFQYKIKWLLALFGKTIAIFSGLFLLNSIYISLFGRDYISISTYLILIPIYALFSKYRARTKMILSLIFYTISVTVTEIDELLGFLMALAYKNGMQLGNIICYVIMFLLVLYLRVFNPEKMKIVPSPYIFLSLLLCPLMIVCHDFLVGYAFDDTPIFSGEGMLAEYMIATKTFCCCIFFGFIMLYMLFFYLFNHMGKEYNLRMEIKTVADSIEKSDAVVQMATVNNDRIREIRHDIKNQFAVLQTMLCQQKYAEMHAYFEEYLGGFADISTTVISGNYVIDIVINLEKMNAESKNIHFDCRTTVAPELPIASSDLCALILNLFDNAIEACDRCQGSMEPYIKASIFQKGNYLIINVTNSASVDKSTFGISQKDGDTHGYGIKIIRRIVEQYNGTLEYEVEQGRCTASAMLLLMPHPEQVEMGG